MRKTGRIISQLFACAAMIIMSLATSGQSAGKITLEDIFGKGIYIPQELEGLNSMKDGEHYSMQNGTRINKYSYKTGLIVERLFDASAHSQIDQFTAYRFDSGEDKILLETGKEQVYRHSYLAEYWVFDRETGKLEPVSEKGKQLLCALSPTGTHVAFVRDNNLFLKDLQKNMEIRVTIDGKKNSVINGAPDWVYEEEFAFSSGFCWSPDGKRIAYYRFDESRVKQFHLTMYGPLYPESYRFKYPKAGEENSEVSVHVYDLPTGGTTRMDTGPETDQYIPRIKWTADPGVLCILRLNRLQNQLDVMHAEASTGETRVVYREVNSRYIKEPNDHTVTYLKDGNHFVLHSEKDGFYHLYLYNFLSGNMQPITSGSYDVDEILGIDEERGKVFYTSYEESTIQKHLYVTGLNGKKKKKLSIRPGTNTASFSFTFDYFIITNSSAGTPHHSTLFNHNGNEVRVLLDNSQLKEQMATCGFAPTEFLTVPTKSGQHLNAWMIKPAGFDPGKKYPLFLFVYGGPESQKVIDEWGGTRAVWFQLLAQRGYVVACVDNRGTDGRGEEFRKATYMQLGGLETIDQLEAAEWFGSQPYIDAERLGIFGWSYGGYMSSLCMTKGGGIFRMGIAVAPVTTWRYYDTIYTERFMRKPQENPAGYDQNSPINFATGLTGKFLLIHGSGDDNVHFQNSMDFAEALVQAGKQFEMQIYPNKSHSITGGNTSLHLYRRMTDFILVNL